MATLSSKTRNKLPKSSFGMPGERKYPMPDKSHARNAKARASQQYNKGNISSSTKAHIDAMANRKLGKKGNSMKKQDPMAHPGHPMNLEMGHAKFSGGNSGYEHDTSSGIPGTHNMPAQHHDKAHPAGPGHPSIHSFHQIGHKNHKYKMEVG